MMMRKFTEIEIEKYLKYTDENVIERQTRK